MFEFIKILTLRATYECQEEGRLPSYLGSTIRGILGHCIRDFCCDFPDKRCFQCEKKDNCLYVQCFSNTGGEAGAVNPYVLYVHGEGRERWKKGDLCVFDLTLLGSGTERAGIYLDALQAAEKRGWGAARLSFRLMQIIDSDSGNVIYAGENVGFAIFLRNRFRPQDEMPLMQVFFLIHHLESYQGINFSINFPLIRLYSFLSAEYRC